MGATSLISEKVPSVLFSLVEKGKSLLWTAWHKCALACDAGQTSHTIYANTRWPPGPASRLCLLALSSAKSHSVSCWFIIQPLPVSARPGSLQEPPGRARPAETCCSPGRGAMLWGDNSDWRPRPRGETDPPTGSPRRLGTHLEAPRWASGWGPHFCASFPRQSRGRGLWSRAGGQGGLQGEGEAASRPGTAPSPATSWAALCGESCRARAVPAA